MGEIKLYSTSLRCSVQAPVFCVWIGILNKSFYVYRQTLQHPFGGEKLRFALAEKLCFRDFFLQNSFLWLWMYWLQGMLYSIIFASIFRRESSDI